MLRVLSDPRARAWVPPRWLILAAFLLGLAACTPVPLTGPDPDRTVVMDCYDLATNSYFPCECVTDSECEL